MQNCHLVTLLDLTTTLNFTYILVHCYLQVWVLFIEPILVYYLLHPLRRLLAKAGFAAVINLVLIADASETEDFDL